jgi:hypothetical protein
MKKSDLSIFIAITLIIVTSTLRLWLADAHLYNFAPVTAVGLFAGFALKRNRLLALAIPLGAQLLADAYFQLFTGTPGFYPGQLFNYGAIGLATMLGFAMKQSKPLSTVAFLFGASSIFFIVSNFGYFVAGFNGYSWAGLVNTYVDAIPFYANTLKGDLIGGVVIFGTYALVQRAFVNKVAPTA